MRLTERKVAYPHCDKQGNIAQVDYIEIKDKKLAEEKLCQLEDIEEEIGIDLITLFKALKNGCWIRKGSHGTCYLEGKAIFIPNVYLHLNLYDYYTERKNEDSYEESESQEALCLFDMYYEDINNIARVRDYGKTWALTKEELL